MLSRQRTRNKILALRLNILRLQVLEGQRRERRMGVREIFQKRKQQGCGDNLLVEMRLQDEEMFFRYMRMNHEMFDNLLHLVGPKLVKRDMCTTLTPTQRLAMTLRYLAAGDFQDSLGFAYLCAQSTVSQVISETLPIVADALEPLYVRAPASEDEWREIERDFEERWNLPHCVGAVDGKHVLIQAPNKSGSAFFNYKHSFSIVLLAACDAKYCFTVVDIGREGRQADGGIFRNSPFGKRLLQCQLHLPNAKFLPGTQTLFDYFFAGDNAFPLLLNLMKPYALKNLTFEQAVYNYRLCRGRRVIENAFGILSARWRILRRPFASRLETATNVVRATIALHNYIRKSNEANAMRYCPPNFADHEDTARNTIPGQWRGDLAQETNVQLQPARRMGARNSTQRTFKQRNELKDYFCGVGKVAWQEDKVREGFWGAAVQNNPQ